MTWYTFFKSLHVVGAVVWIGGGLMAQAYALRIMGAGDARRKAEFAKDTEVVSTRLFIPSAWIVLLAGIGMMINADWAWGQNWIVFGLIAFALSFVLGAGFLGPESGRIAKVIERDGPESPEAQARIGRILFLSRCELVVLITVIVNMVVKPTGNAGWFWGMLLAMVAGIGAVMASYRYSSSSRSVAPPATRSPSAM